MEILKEKKKNVIDDSYKLGFHDDFKYTFKSRKGIDEGVVREISKLKNEPEWMTDFRVKAFHIFEQKKMPMWIADEKDINDIKFGEIYYYLNPTDRQEKKWEDVPDQIKNTFDKIGVPQAEREFLGGVKTQYDSSVIYGSLLKELEDQGVVFLSTDEALQKYPEIFKKYFGTIVPPADNKFAALNSAVWSGGSFVYVPKGVEVKRPLQAYFRINAQNAGQFERTLIIAEEGSYVSYVEGCSAPAYSNGSLHSAVVEIIVKPGARVRYTTIQNWYKNVFNLVTKRAVAYENSVMEWVDGNLGCLAEGSHVTTPSGVKTIESLQEGDLVLSLNEQTGDLCFRRVLAKKFSGYQKIREVSVGERRINVTDNHPFYSYNYDSTAPSKLGRYQLGYVRADNLSKVIVPKTSINYGVSHKLVKSQLLTSFSSNNQYSSFEASRARSARLTVPDETFEDLMWLFGLYLGDGNIDRKEGKSVKTRYAKVGFSVPKDDRARDKLISIMGDLIAESPTERKDGHHLVWNSIELADLIEANGFSGNARTKRLPDWVFSVPESQRLALLAGYLDADGCAVASKRVLSLKSVNRKLLEDVSRLATTLGLTSILYTEFDGEKEVRILGIRSTAHGSHRLEFRPDNRLLPYLSQKFSENIENISPAKLKYFRNIGRSNIDLPETLEIAKAKVGPSSAKEVSTWDIEVEGTGNFICEGFVVHNSRLTVKFPSVYLMGEGARGEILSIAYAGEGQHQHAGGKVIHVAPNTSSRITSKSISSQGGRASYRGLVEVQKGAVNAKSRVECDALIMDEKSRTDTYPVMKINESLVNIEHEATVSKIGEDQLFYLMSRGLSKAEAMNLVVTGFIEPIVKELPLEYAVELNKLIELEMEGSVG